MATIIGLTGGIASGKSTVSRYLAEKGLAVVDADQLVHHLQRPGGRLYQVLVEQFGREILAEDGQLHRSKLAQLIFSSPEALAKSAELQDQIIREELAKERDRLVRVHDLIVLDIPLLFEKGYADWCDVIWLVVVDEQTQLDRLMARNGYTEAEARQRIASQLPLIEKVKLSDYVIDNNGNLDDTYQQVQRLLDDY